MEKITEYAFLGLLFGVLLIGIVALTSFGFSSKVNKGYYPISNIDGLGCRIYTNWENSPDKEAVKTFSNEECVETLIKLNKALAYGKLLEEIK